jgi:hypothetical protein
LLPSPTDTVPALNVPANTPMVPPVKPALPVTFTVEALSSVS